MGRAADATTWILVAIALVQFFAFFAICLWREHFGWVVPGLLIFWSLCFYDLVVR